MNPTNVYSSGSMVQANSRNGFVPAGEGERSAGATYEWHAAPPEGTA
jgi:hypothetical protein